MSAAPRLRWLLALALAAGACKADRSPATSAAAEGRSFPLQFRYEVADGKGELSSGTLRGRATAIAFLATYDLASQAQARFLSGVLMRHVPRINAAAIFLEPRDNRPLIVAFRDALALSYPAALGDGEIIAGRGPFGDVRGVPSIVILDREGRLAWRHVGLAKEEEIEEALRGM